MKNNKMTIKTRMRLAYGLALLFGILLILGMMFGACAGINAAESEGEINNGYHIKAEDIKNIIIGVGCGICVTLFFEVSARYRKKRGYLGKIRENILDLKDNYQDKDKVIMYINIINETKENLKSRSIFDLDKISDGISKLQEIYKNEDVINQTSASGQWNNVTNILSMLCEDATKIIE